MPPRHHRPAPNLRAHPKARSGRTHVHRLRGAPRHFPMLWILRYLRRRQPWGQARSPREIESSSYGLSLTRLSPEARASRRCPHAEACVRPAASLPQGCPRCHPWPRGRGDYTACLRECARQVGSVRETTRAREKSSAKTKVLWGSRSASHAPPVATSAPRSSPCSRERERQRARRHREDDAFLWKRHRIAVELHLRRIMRCAPCHMHLPAAHSGPPAPR